MRIFTVIYIFLLLYVIAALLFWGFSLQKQSLRIYQQEQLLLKEQVDSVKSPQTYFTRLKQLNKTRESRRKQYLGEGTTFLLVILIGAAVVYTSIRRSIRLSRQQNNFMLSVTHELKSPIAGIKLSMQTMQKHHLTEAQQAQLLNRCVVETDRLNELCNNMLIASQMEGRHYNTAKEIFNFTDLVSSSVQDYINRYPGRINESINNNELNVNGDRMLLQMAVNNLLENAIKYSPADKPINVKLFSKNGIITFHVADQGAGVPDNEKKKIFDKFYRVGNEDTRKTKGTGLGLYLTCKIMGQHRGKISVKDNIPNGSLFEICLPQIIVRNHSIA